MASTQTADVRTLARWGLSTALVAVATYLIRIPMPATEGYVNVGDAVIVAVSLLWRWRAGIVAGGVGSAMADLLGGMPIGLLSPF